MVSIQDAERIEQLYARGQKVTAIHQCKELAITALPGHRASLESLCQGRKNYELPRDEAMLEEFMYRHRPYENANAATVVAYCAKWIRGVPTTHSDYNHRDKSYQTHVVATRDDFAQSAFIALRNLALENTGAAQVTSEPVELDYKMMATRDQLLDAFGTWGLKPNWFKDLHGHQWLLDARRIKGQGQRSHTIEPMFCPYAVMMGMIGQIRKPIQTVTGWRILENKFPCVYAAYEAHDPREPNG